jgi:hypothetical protein
MKSYRIYYRQTTNERYDTRMNQTVREAIEDAGIHIDGESGGTYLGTDPDEMASEQVFYVEGPGEVVTAIVSVIRSIVDREVLLTEEEPKDQEATS